MVDKVGAGTATADVEHPFVRRHPGAQGRRVGTMRGGLVVRVSLVVAMVLGGSSAGVHAEEATGVTGSVDAAGSAGAVGATGWSSQVRTGPDGTSVQRELPEGASAGRPVLALGDPTRLLAGPTAAADGWSAPTTSAGLAALRSRLEPTAGVAMTAEDEEAAEDEQEEDWEGPSSVWYGTQVLGDLTGDGVSELATTSYRYPEGVGELQVRRGGDLDVLWSMPSGYTDLRPVGDIDGDGRAEVLLHEVEVTVRADEYRCDEDETTCSGRYEADLRWGASLLDAMTGAVRWSQVHDGHEAYRWAYDPAGIAVQESVDALLVDPAGDVDGDGHVDLALTEVALDHTFTEGTSDLTPGLGLAGERTVAESLDARTDVEWRNGEGTAVRSLVHDEANELALLGAPLGDLDGDGADDALLEVVVLTPAQARCTTVIAVGDVMCDEEQAGGISLRLDARSGRTGAALWSADAGNPFAIFPFGDLDGDGLEDLWILTGAEGYVTTTLSAADGATIWSRTEEDWIFPMVVADVDADDAPEVATAMFALTDEGIEVAVWRLEGDTGAVRSISRPLPAAAWGDCALILSYAFTAPDGDGDGVADLLVGQAVEDLGPGCEGPASSSHAAAATSSGADVTLRQEGGPGLLAFAPAGDLDADGTEDLLQTSWETGEVAALSGLFGPQLWTMESAEFVLGLGVDVDGVPGADLASFELLETPDGGSVDHLRIRNGRDLTVRLHLPEE